VRYHAERLTEYLGEGDAVCDQLLTASARLRVLQDLCWAAIERERAYDQGRPNRRRRASGRRCGLKARSLRTLAMGHGGDRDKLRQFVVEASGMPHDTSMLEASRSLRQKILDAARSIEDAVIVERHDSLERVDGTAERAEPQDGASQGAHGGATAPAQVEE
jgi:hypothetical protein